MEQIKQLEIKLHKFSTRNNYSLINQLIHSTFKEIGYSGNIYAKQDVLDLLISEGVKNYVIWSQDFQFIELCDRVIQVIYKGARMDTKGVLSRHAIRTSIWQKEPVGWQVRFHQATPASRFTKE